jgi:AbrB family looped-hinge helix DNA binding protein
MKDKKAIFPAPGKRFYGTVTVSERGQIVIPASARKDFGIRKGDKILLVGDMEQGIGIITMSMMMKLLENVEILKNLVQSAAAAHEMRPMRNRKAKRAAKQHG